jgi:hypothetical protein
MQLARSHAGIGSAAGKLVKLCGDALLKTMEGKRTIESRSMDVEWLTAVAGMHGLLPAERLERPANASPSTVL